MALSLSVRSVVKRYAGVVALSDANLDVNAGEVVALIGANGSGKSTLSKIINGVVVLDRGQLLLDGQQVIFSSPQAAKKLGIGHKEVTADGQFSLEEVECMGACSWAPAIQINYDFHHHVTPEKLDSLIAELRQRQ